MGNPRSMLYFLCVCLIGSVCQSGVPVGYAPYFQWDQLPQLRLGVKSGLASSYDRTDGNYDWNYYEWPEGRILTETDCIIKTIQGPGVIHRFWMPHNNANSKFPVKMYFDGEAVPRIDTTSDAILKGLFSYFDAPFTDTCAGGQVCYEPIPFSESVRIETTNRDFVGYRDRHYYQYSYSTYPQSLGVSTWTNTLSPESQNNRDLASSILNNAGQNPDTNSIGTIEIATSLSVVDPVLTLGDITGPGVVNEIRIKMPDASDIELQGLHFQVYYDGHSVPDIDIPVAYFFGVGQSRADYNSLPLGSDSVEGFYCYWPMPFKDSIVIKLHNTTGLGVSVNSTSVKYKLKQLNHHTCYLKAAENSSLKLSSDIYHNILNTTGQGHYVGDLLYVEQNYDSFYILEGDDVITIDGKYVQYGTGLEDIYNGGYYYNWVVPVAGEPEGTYPQSATRPLSGILYCNRSMGVPPLSARADQYRWRIADCIPFTESIEVNVECRYGYSGSRWRSVGFWYELPHLLEDIDEDGKVDLKDFAVFASIWEGAGCGVCDYADFTGDSKVTSGDLVEFAKEWLKDY